MRLLFTGRRNGGSWQIRGVQLAAALSAPAIPSASIVDCRAADVIVGVKKVDADSLRSIRASGRPWVYDIVDAYNQHCLGLSREAAIQWVRGHIKNLKPDAVIWPTEAMRKDCGDGFAGFVLPHHARPGMKVNPIRERVEVIGYEGDSRYLKYWKKPLAEAALAIGARFDSRLCALSDCDVVVAVRGGEYANYCTRNWKSAVKLTNAQATGTPFIGQQEAGYSEQASGAERFVDKPAELRDALMRLAPYAVRKGVHEVFVAHARYATPQSAARIMIGQLQSLGLAA